MRFCPDASALLAWLSRDQATDLVNDFWDNLTVADELVAPGLLLAECTSVLRRRVFRRLLSNDEALALLTRAISLPVRTSSNPRQFTQAMEIARQTRRAKAYDMQYVAVAEIEGCELVTLDGGIRQAAIERRVPVRLLR